MIDLQQIPATATVLISGYRYSDPDIASPQLFETALARIPKKLATSHKT
jgi:hypothetical protein